MTFVTVWERPVNFSNCDCSDHVKNISLLRVKHEKFSETSSTEADTICHPSLVQIHVWYKKKKNWKFAGEFRTTFGSVGASLLIFTSFLAESCYWPSSGFPLVLGTENKNSIKRNTEKRLEAGRRREERDVYNIYKICTMVWNVRQWSGTGSKPFRRKEHSDYWR